MAKPTTERPDQVLYDDGCEASASCLTCPLRLCRYDLPGGEAEFRQVMNAKQRRRTLEAHGYDVQRTAAAHRVTPRTVFRWMRQAREVA